MRSLRATCAAAFAVLFLLCTGSCASRPIQTVVEMQTTASETTDRSGNDDEIALPDPKPSESMQTGEITEAAVSETRSDLFPVTELAVTAHVHSFTEKVVAAGCTSGGYTIKTCDCGETLRTDETPPAGHAFGTPQTIAAATCTANGSEQKTCTRCGYCETVQTPRAAHDFTAWVVTQNATENLKGEESCRCKVCGYTLTRQIPERSAQIYTDAEEAKQMLELVNASRAEAGVRPLAFDYARYPAAQLRAKESMQSFSHTRPNGKDFVSVIPELGLSAPDAWAENLQYSTDPQNTLQNAHQMLMNSPGHRVNLLNPKYATAAICVLRSDAGTYIAQLFFA